MAQNWGTQGMESEVFSRMDLWKLEVFPFKHWFLWIYWTYIFVNQGPKGYCSGASLLLHNCVVVTFIKGGLLNEQTGQFGTTKFQLVTFHGENQDRQRNQNGNLPIGRFVENRLKQVSPLVFAHLGRQVLFRLHILTRKYMVYILRSQTCRNSGSIKILRTW